LVPVVEKHLLPLIEDAVEVAMDAYDANEFNDNYTFGTHCWKNLWNRIATSQLSNVSPIRRHGKANEYKFKLEGVILRCHRVDGKSKIPRSAKAAKLYIEQNMILPFKENLLQHDNPENIIVSIDVDPEHGLREVFLGELVKSPTGRGYTWDNRVSVYKSTELESTIEKRFVAPEEEMSHATLLLVEEQPGDQPLVIEAKEGTDKMGQEKGQE